MTFYDGFLVGSSERIMIGYSVLVLEVFLSHKSYNKRFGYS